MPSLQLQKDHKMQKNYTRATKCHLGLGQIESCSTLTKLSYAIENMENNNHLVNLILMASQNLIEISLPCFLMLTLQNQSFGLFRNQTLHFMLSEFQKIINESTLSNPLLIQLGISTIFICTFITLFSMGSEKMKSSPLQALTIFYFYSGLFFMIQGSFFFNQFMEKSAGNESKVLALINILLGIGLNILYKFLAHSYSLLAPNLLCCRFDVFEIATSIIPKIILVVVFAVMAVQDQFIKFDIFVVCQALLLVNASLKLKKEIQSFTYADPFTEIIYRNIIALEISCVLITLICIIWKERLFVENYFYVCFCFYFFMHLALDRYFERRSRSYRLKTKDQVRNLSQAILFLRQLSKLFQTKNINNATPMELYMIKNLYQQHEGSCTETGCFCKGANNHSKNIKQMMPFYKLLSLKIMAELCQRIADNNNEILKIVLEIKLAIHQNFIGVLKYSKFVNLKQLQEKFISRTFFNKYNIKIHKFLENKQKTSNLLTIEKIFQSENLAEIIMGKTQEIVNLKAQFWSNLGKGVIDENFQSKLETQLKSLKEMKTYSAIVLNKFQNSFLLTSLIFSYQQNILFKQKISKELVILLTKLEVIEFQSNPKLYQKKNQPAMIDKFMFSNSACFIEISMSREKLGSIITISKNTQKMFKYQRWALIGKNINKIMPAKMHMQHDQILKNWTQTCSWSSLGKFKEVYCLNSENVCFSAIMYLKPIQRQNCINLIGLISKQNDQDYLIIDDKNCIVSAGYNFIHAFGKKIINLPIQFVFQEPKLLEKWAEEDDKVLHRMSSYSTKSFLFDGQQEQQAKVNAIHEELINKNKEELRANQSSKIDLKFSVGKIQFGKLTFKFIKLCQIPENVHKIQQKLKNPLFTEPRTSHFLRKSQVSYQKQGKNFIGYNPSISSSRIQQSVSTLNTLNKLEKLFYSEELVTDKRVSKFVLIIILLCLGSFVAGINKIAINQKGYKEIQELLSAGQASSDNLQLTMLLFNRALTISLKMQAYLQDFQFSSSFNAQRMIIDQLEVDLEKLTYEQNYLHDLIEQQIFKYDKSLSSLTQTSMFQYQTNLLNWRSVDGEQVKITTFKFIDNFLYFSNEIYKLAVLIISKMNESKPKISQAMELYLKLSSYAQVLKNNFLELDKINESDLDYYQSLLKSSIQYIKLFTYVKISLTLLALLIIVLILFKYRNFRVHQNYKIFEVYRFVTRDSVIGLFEYYVRLRKLFKKRKEKKEKQEYRGNIILQIHEQYDQYFQTHHARQKQTQKSASQKLSILKSGTIKTKITLAGIFVLTGILNLLIQGSEKAILTKSQQVFQLLDDFIVSQNSIIAPYLIKKANQKLEEEQLEGLFKDGQVGFTKIVVSSINQFKNFDLKFEEKMKKIFTQNICTLTKYKLTKEHFDQCVEGQQMKFIKFGIGNAMNYFNRALLQFLAESEVNELPPKKTFTLPKIDRTLFQMFNVFQVMQQQLIADTLKAQISNQKIQFLFYISAELTIFLVFALYAIKFYFYEKRRSSDRVGRILLLPFHIVKNQPKILQNFETAIDYQNLRGQ